MTTSVLRPLVPRPVRWAAHVVPLTLLPRGWGCSPSGWSGRGASRRRAGCPYWAGGPELHVVGKEAGRSVRGAAGRSRAM